MNEVFSFVEGIGRCTWSITYLALARVWIDAYCIMRRAGMISCSGCSN